MLKINKIGKSASEYRLKWSVKVQRLGIETVEIQNIIYPRASKCIAL